MQKREKWEDEIEQSDWERFYWEKSPSFKKLVSYIKEVSPDDVVDESQIMEKTEVNLYREAVAEIYDKGETEEALAKYKEGVEKILFNQKESSKS